MTLTELLGLKRTHERRFRKLAHFLSACCPLVKLPGLDLVRWKCPPRERRARRPSGRRTNMPAGRQARLAALTGSYPVTVRATRDCGDGLFATAACEADTLLISDVPLAWLPSSKQRLPTCAGCGACLGSAGAQLGGELRQFLLRLPDRLLQLREVLLVLLVQLERHQGHGATRPQTTPRRQK